MVVESAKIEPMSQKRVRVSSSTVVVAPRSRVFSAQSVQKYYKEWEAEFLAYVATHAGVYKGRDNLLLRLPRTLLIQSILPFIHPLSDVNQLIRVSRSMLLLVRPEETIYPALEVKVPQDEKGQEAFTKALSVLAARTERLVLHGAKGHQGLASLMQHTQKLRSLDVSQLSLDLQVTSALVPSLPRELRELNIRTTSWPSAMWTRLLQTCPKLHSFRISSLTFHAIDPHIFDDVKNRRWRRVGARGPDCSVPFRVATVFANPSLESFDWAWLMDTDENRQVVSMDDWRDVFDRLSTAKGLRRWSMPCVSWNEDDASALFQSLLTHAPALETFELYNRPLYVPMSVYTEGLRANWPLVTGVKRWAPRGFGFSCLPTTPFDVFWHHWRKPRDFLLEIETGEEEPYFPEWTSDNWATLVMFSQRLESVEMWVKNGMLTKPVVSHLVELKGLTYVCVNSPMVTAPSLDMVDKWIRSSPRLQHLSLGFVPQSRDDLLDEKQTSMFADRLLKYEPPLMANEADTDRVMSLIDFVLEHNRRVHLLFRFTLRWRFDRLPTRTNRGGCFYCYMGDNSYRDYMITNDSRLEDPLRVLETAAFLKQPSWRGLPSTLTHVIHPDRLPRPEHRHGVFLAVETSVGSVLPVFISITGDQERERLPEQAEFWNEIPLVAQPPYTNEQPWTTFLLENIS
jgi:hypothetical protein